MKLEQRSGRGSAIVITLLVISMLTIVVISFLTSMRIERLTSNSYMEDYKSRLVSDAAHADALARLVKTTTDGPFSTIYLLENDTPYLFFSRRDISLPDHISLIRVPLFTTIFPNQHFTSGTKKAFVVKTAHNLDDLGEDGAPIVRAISKNFDLFTDINAITGPGEPPAVGLLNNGTDTEILVNWIYFRDSSGKIIGRYAFWIDDESSKIDILHADETSTQDQKKPWAPNVISAHALKKIGLTGEQVNHVVEFKGDELSAMNCVDSVRFRKTDGSSPELLIDDDQWEILRPWITVFAREDDRSPDGKRKLNLNEAIEATSDPNVMQAQIDALAKSIAENLPAFGMRYYKRNSAKADAITQDVSEKDRNIYIHKIAANIRDYIDSDNTATLLNRSGEVIPYSSGSFVPYELLEEEIPIIGKETGPFLSEYSRVVRVLSPANGEKSEAVTLRFAHYIELYNPTGRDIAFADLGPDPHILICNREKWYQSTSKGSPNTLRPADIRIYLPENFVIPAGGYSVITNDGPPWTGSQQDYYGPPDRYTVIRTTEGDKAGTWECFDAGGQDMPKGEKYEDYAIITSLLANDRYGFASGETGASYQDNRERLILANSEGIIDCSLKIYTNARRFLGRNDRNPQWLTTFHADPETSNRNTQSGSDKEPRFSRGDLRSNTEIVSLNNDSGAVWKTGGAGYGDKYSTSSHQQTLGAINYNYSQDIPLEDLCNKGWREYSNDPVGNHFVANRDLFSVGELGFIYDPSRYDINGFRSYGSTLRIGQSDDPTNNRASNSLLATHANWLGGVGSNDTSSTEYFKNAHLLASIFRIDDKTSGKINLNGIVRGDNGNILVSCLTDGFSFVRDTSGNMPTNMASATLGGKKINPDAIEQNLSWSIKKGVPPEQIGDITALRVFDGDWTHPDSNVLYSLVDDIDMNEISDAGKEEFFRRSSNLLTTKSLSFSVYTIGQSGKFKGNTFHVQGSTRCMRIISLEPVYENTNPLEPEEPSDWKIITHRKIDF